MSIFTTSPTIQSDTATTFTVRGRISYLNGSGIPGQIIDTVIKPGGIENKMAPLNYVTPTPTLSGGAYEDNIALPPLLAGDFKVLVRPEGRNAIVTNSSHLTAIPHPVTFDHYVQYLAIATAVGASILGGLIKIPPYISEKKRARTLRNCILDREATS